MISSGRLGKRLTAPIQAGLTASGRALGGLAFPWSCLICGAEGARPDGPLCQSCRRELLDTAVANRATACPRCALTVGPFTDLNGGCSKCRGRSLGFDAALALGPYEGVVRDLCLRLKLERNAWLAPWLSGLLAEARRDDLAAWLPADAWVAPVPLHWWRRLRRGYNQAEALARGLARPLDRKVHLLLRRVKPTHRLAKLKPRERAEALRGAFRARWVPGLSGRTVLLVDDVLTTGATCGAAARALKQAGARHVIAAVIARAL